MMSKKSLALVYAVDQMLDYYEVNDKPLPPEISVTRDTYDALLEYSNEVNGIKLMQLTHYRKVPVKVVSRNSKT